MISARHECRDPLPDRRAEPPLGCELARDFLVAAGGAAANDIASGGEVHGLTGGPVDEAEKLTRLVRARAVARSRASS